MQLNIDDMAVVRLTAAGREKLSEWVLTWSKPGVISADDMFPQMPDGTTKFTLWELMAIFGPSLYHGCELSFDRQFSVEPSFSNLTHVNNQ